MNEQHPKDQPDKRPVLLQLRLRGKILDPASPASAALVGTGHASSRGEHLILSPAGRATAETEFRFDPDDPDGHHGTTRSAYEQFLPRNVELIRVCNDWQVRPGGVPNDHHDAGYDWGLIDRLTTIDDRIGPVIRRLGTSVAHFNGYRARLRTARTKVEDGDRDWFTSPRIDSYHTVWMELHEHLLVALGLERSAESAETT